VHYANLGSAPLSVSKFGLGTMTFGTGEGFAGLRPRTGETTSTELISVAIDHGVTVFDSSGHYNDGEAEIILGRAVRHRRDRVIVSTKDPVFLDADAGPVREQVIRNVEASLRRLALDAIDIYQVGVLDLARLGQALDEIGEGLDGAIGRGLVRHGGVTNMPAWCLERLSAAGAAQGLAPIVAAQMSYSLLDRQIELEYQPLLIERGIGVLAWSPLAGGFLTGKYTANNPDGGGGRLSVFRLQPINREQGYDVVALLGEIAQTYDVTPAAVALSWAASKPFVSSVILGATSTDRLVANLKAAELQLTPQDLNRLDEMSTPPRPYPYWLYPARQS
jgi:aryl-alcohol dehydrogenase-like predicted oxidoreductase